MEFDVVDAVDDDGVVDNAGVGLVAGRAVPLLIGGFVVGHTSQSWQFSLLNNDVFHVYIISVKQ